MKNLLAILSLAFLYSGCYSSYLYTEYANVAYEEPEYTNLPMKPNESEVEVIFPGEKVSKPYIQVDLIESSGEAFKSSKALITDLKVKGMFRGVDAIILISNSNFSYEDGEYVSVVKSATGLGIKYVENINYLDNCIKQVKVVALDERTNEFKNAAEIKTNWKGNLLELKNGDSFFWDFLYNFSDQHLIHEMNGWSFNERKRMDGKSYTTRVLGKNKDFTKTVTIDYITQQEANLVVIDKLNKNNSASIKCYYNDEGVLVAKEIDSEVLGKFKMEVTLGENNHPLQYDVYKILDGEKELYFKAMFEMYEQENLDALLADENIIGG